MNRVIQFLGSLSDREEGQTLTEYAVILSLISVASIAFLTPLSDAINALYTTVTNAF
jgi:Flp pilus assembly pilin Flp